MGSDQTFRRYDAENIISIHAPRMGSDLFKIDKKENNDKISINAPRMGSDFQRGFRGFRRLFISINAPRMGSDVRVRRSRHRENLISINAPRMGSDRENGHLRPRYGQNHPFSTLIVSQIVIDVLGTVRKSQKTPAH